MAVFARGFRQLFALFSVVWVMVMVTILISWSADRDVSMKMVPAGPTSSTAPRTTESDGIPPPPPPPIKIESQSPCIPINVSADVMKPSATSYWRWWNKLCTPFYAPPVCLRDAYPNDRVRSRTIDNFVSGETSHMNLIEFVTNETVSLTSSHTDATPVRRTLTCNTCAVVGSSAWLLGKSLGRDIDNHDCVFRMNYAPSGAGGFLDGGALPWANDVGNRTTIRVLVWNFPSRTIPCKMMDPVRFLMDVEHGVVIWSVVPPREQESVIIPLIQRELPHLKYYHFSSQSLELARAELKKHAGMMYTCSRHESGVDKPASFWFSTGFYTMLMAKSMCNSIDVYGLGGPRMMSNIDEWRRSRSPVYYYGLGSTETEQSKSYFIHDLDVIGDKGIDAVLQQHVFELEKDIMYEWKMQDDAQGIDRFHFFPPMWSLGIAQKIKSLVNASHA